VVPFAVDNGEFPTGGKWIVFQRQHAARNKAALFEAYQNDLLSLVAEFPKVPCAEVFTMAEITKLPVGQLLDKLRSSSDTVKSTTALLDEKIKTAREEAQRLRATRRRLERDQGGGSTGRD
jgi:hypothetical protein